MMVPPAGKNETGARQEMGLELILAGLTREVNNKGKATIMDDPSFNGAGDLDR